MLLKRAPEDRDGFIAHIVKSFELDPLARLRARRGAPARDARPLELRPRVQPGGHRAPARGDHRLGRSLAVLKRITAPTLVIHGKADKLVSPSGGRATAKAIPGAKLLEIDGMGHDLPRGVWPQVIDAIAENAARAKSAPEPMAVAA